MRKLLFLILSVTLLACQKDDDGAGTSLATDPAQFGTPFNEVPAAGDVQIYQVNPRAFSAAGNLQGIAARLDSIKALGINTVYLMPIYRVGSVRSVNSPYAIKDYKEVSSEFGTLEDLRTLVTEAHQRKMAVLMDFVANHTAWDHPWVTAHKNWYQQNAAGDIVSPANYNDVAQLNFNNEAMRAALIEAMRYWVFTANVDGFRFDFADAVPYGFWKDAVASLRSINNRKLLLLAEGTRTDHFSAGFDFTFGFGFFGTIKEVFGNNKSATEFNAVNKSEYNTSNGAARVVRYITNHDVNLSDGTPLDLFGGEKGSLAAFVVAAYMKGIPMVYNGQEIGYASRISYFKKDPINWTSNPGITAEYKKLLGFRNSSAAVKAGQLFTYSSDDVAAFSKELPGEKALVLVNLRARAVNYTLPASFAGSTLVDALNGGDVKLAERITLQPYAYLVLKGK